MTILQIIPVAAQLLFWPSLFKAQEINIEVSVEIQADSLSIIINNTGSQVIEIQSIVIQDNIFIIPIEMGRLATGEELKIVTTLAPIEPPIISIKLLWRN